MVDKAMVWREHVTVWRSSGLSAAAFCREHALSYAQFVYWQRRLGRTQSALVPVQVAAATPRVSGVAVELGLPGGVRLCVTGVGMADVAALVRALAC